MRPSQTTPGSAASAARVRSSSELGLSGSVGPASISSTASPSARSRRTALTASSTPLLRSMRPTSASLMTGPSRDAPRKGGLGSGSGAKCAVSTPEPRIRTSRAGSIPAVASASPSSGFCTMIRASPAVRRNPRHSPWFKTARPARATWPVGANSASAKLEPRPFTAATHAGRPARLGNASRSAAPPNSTGFSATWCTMSGRSRRYSAAIAATARPAPTTRSPRRRQFSASRRNPSLRMRSPCTRSRAATTTSNPASRAARAIGRRCDQKYQSSVTRRISFGRSRGGRSLKALSFGALDTASTPQSGEQQPACPEIGGGAVAGKKNSV